MAARHLALQAETEASGYPSVTWFGVTSILVDDGTTQVLIDGFFSRPKGSLLNRIAPDPKLLDPGFLENYEIRDAGCTVPKTNAERCASADRTGLGLVVPAHAHFDHVLDAPLIAGLTGAPLFGGPSVERVAQATTAWFGDTIDPIHRLTASDTEKLLSAAGLRVGSLTVGLIETPHAHTPAAPIVGGETDADFSFPARKWSMKEGTNYAVWIDTGSTRLLVIPSAGHISDELVSRGIEADTVFLGIGYAGRLTANEFKDFWTRSVPDVGATKVVLTHWDDMRGMLDPNDPMVDLKPWRLFWLDKTWARVKALSSRDGVEIVHLRAGKRRAIHK